MHISEKIQILRRQKDISQEQLAEQLNVSRQAVSKWETGENLPDIENIVQLSKIFNVSTDYLLKTYNDESPIDMHSPSGKSLADELMMTLDDEDETTGRFNFTLNFSGIIYPAAVLVFLVLGFHWGMWRAGLVVFPIAWVIEEIVSFAKTGRFDISVYSIASIVFLVLGLGWGLWHPGWLVFVVAWVLSEAIQVKKPKRKKRGKKKCDNGQN